MKKELISTEGIRLLSFLSIFILSNCLKAQEHVSLNRYDNQSEIKAKSSVTLTDGFSVPSGSTVRIFTGASFQNCVPFVGLPSANQNYVSNRIFKRPGVNVLNIDSSRSTCEVNQVIQYFDGLGRPLQTVQVQASPDFRDVVQPIAYDAFGREQFKYLPYASALTSSNGSFKAEAISAQASFYANPLGSSAPGVTPILGVAFSETRFEASPLNRVLEQGAPGVNWQLNAGHTQKIVHGANIASEVRLWNVTGAGADGGGYYQAGTLYKTISKDENWKPGYGKAGTIEEFKDLQGRVVLKRIWETDGKGLDTYYVYDDFGSLSYVLPPAVNENGQSPVTAFTETDDVFKHFMYGYHYDGRKRVIEKKVPGKGWEHLIYNKLDQLVLSQDALQRAGGQWLFTKYDALGRVVMTGLYNDTSTRPVLQTAIDPLTVLWEKRVATGEGYDNGAFPQSIAAYHTINYYDDYSFPGNSFPQPDGITQMDAARVKGLLTGGFVYQSGSTARSLSVNYYDAEGRVIRVASQNHLGGTDVTDNSWNFAGELTASTRSHTASASGLATTIANRYDYDHVGRKLATMESINGGDEVVLSKLTYNALGQLWKKQLHSSDGSNFMQQTEYAYNERGWLKQNISDQFNMELIYDGGADPQFNGNIAQQRWGAIPNVFTYTYDRLNRLIKGVSTGVNMSEELIYDEMGNIKSLDRDGAGASIYTYLGNASNQLLSIAGGSLTTGTYGYDANGNMTTDGRTGAVLSYNHLNLPVTAVGTGLNIAYTYDATGNKLTKTSNGAVTQYVSGIHYKPDGTIDFIQTEAGMARRIGTDASGYGTYNYEYTLTDHLGNSRYSFDIYAGGVRRIQQQDYYPFGKVSNGQYVSGDKNNYLYNGKELQEELGQFDYGARFYDPEIGRWNVIDPLAEDMRKYSPYVYVYNNPMRFIDPDGMKGDDWVKRGDDYRWDDRVVDQKTAEEFQGEGAKYIGKEVQVAVQDRDGNLRGHIGLHSDGSISKGDWKIEAGSSGYFTNSNGSTFRSRQTEGGFIGLTAGFAAIGGASLSVGMVSDATGATSGYISFSGNIGLGIGAGLDFGEAMPTQGNQFYVNDFAGKGGTYNVGIETPLINVGGSYGGSLNPGTGGSKAMNINNLGKNDFGYTTRQVGVSPGGRIGASAMYSYGTTKVFR